MSAPATTAVVLTPKKVADLLLTQQAQERIAPFLPKGAEIARVVAAVQMAVADNEQLQKCTPASLVRAVAKIQQWGLEIGYTAHLVPFGQIATPIADYKGLAQLVIASGAVRSVDLRVVYEKEHFAIQYGTDPKIEHIPLYRKADRGPIIGAYVVFGLPFGRSSFHFMGADDIDDIRQKHSKQWKQGPLPPWYAAKTVLRQGVKLLPKDAKLAEALRVVADEERTEIEPGEEIESGPRVYALREPGEEPIDDRDLDDFNARG